MRRPIAFHGLMLCVLLSLGCDGPPRESGREDGARRGESSRYLYVWARDTDEGEQDTDFLAVIDANPSSAWYRQVIATAPVGSVGTGAHHAESVAPIGAPLFANGFTSGRTFLFDLSEPASPRVTGELDPVPE